MKVLVIGGTRFVGRHLVRALVAAGHEVALFNRGKTEPIDHRGVHTLRGDRRTDVGALRGAPGWDAVIDTCGYVLADMPLVLSAVAPRIGRYLFISSVAVYDAAGRTSLDETSPLLSPLLDDVPLSEAATRYGRGKVACERCVLDALGDRATLVRPGIITGRFDPTRRFGHYVSQTMRGGPFIAPGDPERPLQLIDARDLAAFVVVLLEEGRDGVWNVAADPSSPRGSGRLTFGGAVDACVEATGSAAQPQWVDEASLDLSGAGGSALPLFYRSDDAVSRTQFSVSSERALHAGLRLRPLVETARNMADWLAGAAAADAQD